MNVPGLRRISPQAPWHFLYFFPLPHQQGSLRPSLGSSRRTVFTGASSPPVRAGVGAAPLRGGAAVAAADDEPPLSVMGVGRRGAGRGTGAGASPPSPLASTTGRSRHI